MKLKIRKSTFETLFRNVLFEKFCETWSMKQTNDDSINPLVVFKTKIVNKLLKLCKEYVSNYSHLPVDDNFPLHVGKIKGLIIQVEMLKRQKSIGGK